jgi:hypothetical protein
LRLVNEDPTMAITGKVPRKQRAYAAVLAIIGIVSVCVERTYPAALGMCGLLLIAWREAFVPSPSAKLALGDIRGEYSQGRQGTSATAKAVTIAGILLVIASIALGIASRA